MTLQKLVFLLLASFLFTHTLQGNHPFDNSRFTEVNGLMLHYRVWLPDEGETRGNVLMLHGFAGSTFSWQKAGDSLAKAGYKAVAIDIPPFGFSDRDPQQNQSVSAKAKLINDFLEQQFPGTAWHLAGHSMGGGIVQAMALMFPDNYKSVNFVAATLFTQIQKEASYTPLWMNIPGLTTFAGNVAESWFITPRRIEDLLASAYGQTPSKEQVKAYLEPLEKPGTARAILHMQKNRDEIAELHIETLSVPAIAIWGAEDSWVSAESRKHVLEKKPAIRLAIIEDAGHNPMETHFEQFMALWLPFLNNH